MKTVYHSIAQAGNAIGVPKAGNPYVPELTSPAQTRFNASNADPRLIQELCTDPGEELSVSYGRSVKPQALQTGLGLFRKSESFYQLCPSIWRENTDLETVQSQ